MKDLIDHLNNPSSAAVMKRPKSFRQIAGSALRLVAHPAVIGNKGAGASPWEMFNHLRL